MHGLKCAGTVARGGFLPSAVPFSEFSASASSSDLGRLSAWMVSVLAARVAAAHGCALTSGEVGS